MGSNQFIGGMLVVAMVTAWGCGSAQGPRTDTGLCAVGESHLRQKLGPEFGKIHSKMVFSMPEKAPHGCVLVYSRIPEELPMEMTGDVLEAGASDHMLSMVFSDGRDQPRFTRVPRSRTAPGPVLLRLSKRDVNGDTVGDLVVEERGPDSGLEIPYRGLRLFDGQVGGGREFFSGALLITTKDGMRVTPRWKVATVDQKSALVFSAAGIKHTYVFDARLRRFSLQAAPKKTVAPAQPAPAQPDAATTKGDGAEKAAAPPAANPGGETPPADD